eukprot:COSAG06_NODE_1475_length_9337_cov_6.585733_9_plen_228_part_00
MIAINGGDEIDLTTHLQTNNTQFQEYLKRKNISLDAVGCAQIGWKQCNMSTGTAANASDSVEASARFYHTHKFIHDAAILSWQNKTKEITKFMPHSKVGPNIAPTRLYTATQDGKTMYGGALSYIGETYQMVRGFREKAITLPWTEDYIWPAPVGSQQIMTLSYDAFRSGLMWADRNVSVVQHEHNTDAPYKRLVTPKKHQDIHAYVMPRECHHNSLRRFFIPNVSD